MKKIKMIKTSIGYQDGVNKEVFDAEQTYEVTDGIADAFLSMKWAENVLEINTDSMHTTEDCKKKLETPEDPKPVGPENTEIIEGGKSKKAKGKK